MQFYLIRHGQADTTRSADPYAPPLTALGRAQAEAVAQACREWQIQFLCASTMRRAQETADIIHQQTPQATRWDLEELEDVTLDDLNYEPGASHLVSTWAPEQFDRGLGRTWIRVMAALAVRCRVLPLLHSRPKLAGWLGSPRTFQPPLPSASGRTPQPTPQ